MLQGFRVCDHQYITLALCSVFLFETNDKDTYVEGSPEPEDVSKLLEPLVCSFEFSTNIFSPTIDTHLEFDANRFWMVSDHTLVP